MIIMKSAVKGSVSMAILLLILVIFLAIPSVTSSRRISKTHIYGGGHHRSVNTKQPAATPAKPVTKRTTAAANPGRDASITTRSTTSNWFKRKPTGGDAAMWVKRPAIHGHAAPDPLQVAGSSLPDCSHACGSCSPCRLVMVSFVCATLEEAETCPMAYKCMCRNKSYPVP